MTDKARDHLDAAMWLVEKMADFTGGEGSRKLIRDDLDGMLNAVASDLRAAHGSLEIVRDEDGKEDRA